METPKKKHRLGKTSGFGQAVLASLRGWERGEPITVRKFAGFPSRVRAAATK
jgi:hypothetical protein